jgi:hypothetical protein
LGARLQDPLWKKVLKNSGLSDEDSQKIIEKLKSGYVQWEENAFPGMLANVISGRITNRLDLGGMNYVVDVTCTSSLGALRMAIIKLVEHRADMMITGGVDTDNSIFAYMCFSKTPAVSPGDKVKPFDADADGMMLGEGVGMLVLKRLENAQRDGDRTLREAIVQLQVAGLSLQNLDPYQIATKIPEVPQQKVLNIRLNSTNITEKAQKTFAKALENGHHVEMISTVNNNSLLPSHSRNRHRVNPGTD